MDGEMIAAELRGGSKPSLNEALGWIGSRVDDINGVAIGRLEDIWIDPATGEPRWLLVKEGRFGGRSTLVPFDDAVPGDGHVWIPYERDVVREAPQVEPAVPLTQQVEMTLRNHYAANTTAAVSQGAQQPDPAAAGEPEPEQGGTVRLASAQPAPGPGEVPPPRMPERPAPPVNAPPPMGGRQEQQGAFPGQAEPPRQPFQQQPPQQQPPPQQTPAPQQQQQAPPPQPPPASPHPQQQPPPPQWVQAPSPVWGEPAQHPTPPEPATPPPPAYQPPPPPQPVPADPLSVLAGLPPGQMVEIELSGDLTIRGELRQIRIVPPEQPGYRG
jgi:sporulation protein YlmC with PRC-barrel domain